MRRSALLAVMVPALAGCVTCSRVFIQRRGEDGHLLCYGAGFHGYGRRLERHLGLQC